MESPRQSDPASLSDEELASLAAREGSDGVAFTALMDRYRERVWRVCWRLMGTEHDAEDAAQEVFVRLFFERGKFAGRSRYSTRRRRRESSDPGGEVSLVEAHADPQASPEAAVDAAHDARKVLEHLDEEDRALVLMRFAENHDYEELAEMFGSTSGALRMRVSRIREKLAAKAGPMLGE
jgi:RNA polymerase sigma-70 factor (ECF subfamily)